MSIVPENITLTLYLTPADRDTLQRFTEEMQNYQKDNDHPVDWDIESSIRSFFLSGLLAKRHYYASMDRWQVLEQVALPSREVAS